MFSQGIKIKVTGSQWKFENHVELQYDIGSCDTLKLGKSILRDIKRTVKDPLKPRLNFEPSCGYLSGNIWYFDRDTAWLRNNGIIQLVMRNTDTEFPCSDTLRIQLVKLSDINVNFTSPEFYFNKLFQTVEVTLANGEKGVVNADFEGKSNILQGVKMESNATIIKGVGDFGNAFYKLSESTYTKDIKVRFVDKSSGKVYQTENLPNTIYRRDYKVIGNGHAAKTANHGKTGSVKLLSKATDTLSFTAFSALNGGNGENGLSGEDAQDFKIKVERVNEIDSIAKIKVTNSDTTFCYIVDLFGGGHFTLEAIGAYGCNGGNAGLYGAVFYKFGDSIKLWKQGKEGLPGSGGNGGTGGDVILEIDRLYQPILNNIKIENKGGKMGFGGIKNYPSYYNYPYFTGEGALLLKTWERIFGYNLPRSIDEHLKGVKYYDGNPNLGKSGRAGADGKTVISYFN